METNESKQEKIDYERFIQQLRNEPELTLKLKAFVDGFPRKGDHKKQVALFIEQMISDSESAKSFSPDSFFERENVSEGWEKLVLSKVYDLVFCKSDEHKLNQG
jgi:hypothetical protein